MTFKSRFSISKPKVVLEQTKKSTTGELQKKESTQTQKTLPKKLPCLEDMRKKRSVFNIQTVN